MNLPAASFAWVSTSDSHRELKQSRGAMSSRTKERVVVAESRGESDAKNRVDGIHVEGIQVERTSFATSLDRLLRRVSAISFHGIFL